MRLLKWIFWPFYGPTLEEMILEKREREMKAYLKQTSMKLDEVIKDFLTRKSN
jgi:hypothetical protein